MNFSHNELLDGLTKVKRYSRTLGINQEDQEDLVNDVAVRALENEEKFEKGTNLGAWLVVMCHSLYIDKKVKPGVKRQNIINTVRHDKDSIYTDRVIDEHASEMHCLFNEMAKHIEEILPYKTQVVLSMIGEGYSYQNVADRISLPVNVVRNRLWRSRDKLREFAGA